MSANFSGILKPPFVIPEIQGWQGYTVLGLIGFMLVSLVAEFAPPYLVMMGTLVIFLALSILDVEAALHGFADEAMLSVAVLFIVAKGIEQSGCLEYVASVLFKTPNKRLPGSRSRKTEGSIVWVLLKFSIPVAIFSAFLANIPLVAMMIPPIVEFGRKVNMPPSKMLLPLSYAAQLGGTMTLIGASTNLMVLSMAAQKLPEMKMNLFEIGIIGVPVTIAGVFYIIAFSGKLLPDRLTVQQTTHTINAREYNVVLVLKPTSRLARKSIEKSGINRQPGLALLSINRDGTEITSPTPDFVLQPKDHLHFVGVVDSVILLVQMNGLILSEDEGKGEVDLNRLKTDQCLVEAVVASQSPMVHKRIADLQFRERYNAAVVAVHRYGTRLSSAFGDIKLEGGDCLLLVVDGPEFVIKHRNNSTFALVAQLPGFKPVNRRKAGIAAVLVLALVVASGVGVKLITAALFSAAGLLITKCLSPRDAMESIELPVLIMIAAAFGIAEGMVQSGAATMLAKALMGLAGKSLFGLVTCTYVATTIFSLAITNNAAVTIMFPVALAAANHQTLDFRPFAYILMMAASAGFMTPTGCPTNLLVYTPGGYKFSDYISYGGPMQILLLLVTVGITITAKYWFIWWIVIFLITFISVPLIARHKSTHPKPMPASGPASSPEVKPSTSDSDAENPKAPLNAGNEDSSRFTLNSSTSLRGDDTSVLPASSNPKTSPSSLSSPGASAPPACSERSAPSSGRISGSSSHHLMEMPSSMSNKEPLKTLPTFQDLPVSDTFLSSSPPTKSLLDSPSSSHATNPLPKPTTESTQSPSTTFLATGPSWSAPVSVPSLSKPSTLPTKGTTWPNTSIPSKPSTLPTKGTTWPSTSIPNSETPASRPTQKISSPGPAPLHMPSIPKPASFLTKNTNLPANISSYPQPTSMPTILSTLAAPTVEMESNSSPISRSPPYTSGSGPALELRTSTIQQPTTFILSNPTSRQEAAVASLLTQSPTSTSGSTSTRMASLSPSPGPVSTPMLSPSQTSTASTVRTGPSPTLMPVSEPISLISRQGRVASRGTSIFPQYSPPPTAVAFPLVSIPYSEAGAAKCDSLIHIIPPIPTAQGSGRTAAMFDRLTRPEPPIPVILPVPVLPGPGTVACKREPTPPKPVIVPIPSIPGPGTVAAQRANLTPPEPTSPRLVTVPTPSIPGSGTIAAQRATLTPPVPTSPRLVTVPIPSITGSGTVAPTRATTPPEPNPPIPVKVPMPIIPGPGTVAANRGALTPSEPTSPIPVMVPSPSITGLGTVAPTRAILNPPEPNPSILVTEPILSIPVSGNVAAKHTTLTPPVPNPPTRVTVPLPSIPGPGTVAANRAALTPPEPTSTIPVMVPSPSITGPGTVAPTRGTLNRPGPNLSIPVTEPPLSIPVSGNVAAKRTTLTTPEPNPPILVTVPIPSIPGPGTPAAKRNSLTWQEKRSSLLGKEKPPVPVSMSVAVQDTTTDQPLTDKDSGLSSAPIIVFSYKPKRPSYLHVSTSESRKKSSVDAQTLEIGSHEISRHSVSEPSTAEPLFFTTPTLSSNPPRRPTPPPWSASERPSRPAADPNKRRPSNIIEEDLTGGISDLMIPRRLSSIRDVDAFADRWQGTTI